MSFGGGREQYTLEYIVKVVNQGGGGALNQINQGFTKTSTTATQATVSTEKLAAASNRLSQANMGMTKAMKSTAFGMFGITTAGAEMFGMLSMLQQVQLAQKEALEEQSAALKEGGKESKAYKDATMEVVKVNRWAAMTQRNFMLSIFDMVPFTIMAVHGITKMVTAAKELKAAKAAADNLRLLGFNASGVAAQMLRAGTSIGGFTPQLSKFSNATTIATTGTFKFGQETVKTTKFFGAGEAALISNAVAMGKSSQAATGAAKAMRVLGIAMKVLIPLIALEVGAQAFANNWGGFRDKINEVGVAIGNTIPALKGMLGWIDKIGRSIVAIFTGDFESIGDIWDTDKMEKGIQLSDTVKKAQEELAQSIKESAQAGSELVTEFVEMDKKARKTFLFEHGIKGGAKKRVTEALEGLDELKQHFVHFGEDLKLIRLDEQLDNWFDLPKSFYKKVGFTMEDRFKDLGKELGDKGLINLGEEMRKAAKSGKGYEAYKQAVIDAVKFDPSLMSKLEVLDPEAYAQFKQILDEEKERLAKIVGEVFDPKDNSLWQYNDDTALGEGESMLGRNHNKQGMFGGLIESLKSGAQQLGIEIDAVNWNELGLKVKTGLETVFTIDNANALGGWIKLHLINPMMKALQEQLKPVVEAFAKDPIGYTIGVINGISDIPAAFIAGLFGFKSAEDMQTKIEGALFAFFNEVPVLQELRKIINNPSGYILQYLKGGGAVRGDVIAASGQFNAAETSTFPERGFGDTNMLARITQWLQSLFDIKNWKTAISNLANPQFWADVTTSINDAVNNALDRLQAANKADEARFDKNAPYSGGMGPSGWIQEKIAPFFNFDTWKGLIDQAANLLKPQVADAMETSMSGDWWKTSNNTNPVTPGDKSGKGLPKSFTDEFPGTYGTPIVDIPNMILKPKNFTPDLSNATPLFKGQSDNPGKEGSGMPGSWAPAYALYIDYPGTAVVTPASTVVNIDWVSIMTTAGVTMASIEQGWIKTMTNMSSLANTTVQAIALVFGGMVINISAGMTGLANTWSAVANSFMNNASAAGNGIIDNMESAMSDVESKMTDLAKHWSKMCNSMIANAKSAAKGITKAMDSIPDTESVHTIRVRRVNEYAEGGEMTNAISAAGGRILTTHGEQMFKIGDNPGGIESVWAIPHNRPGPIVEQINATYGGGGSGGGNTELNQTLQLRIDGNDIINNIKFDRRIKSTVGERMDRF